MPKCPTKSCAGFRCPSRRNRPLLPARSQTSPRIPTSQKMPTSPRIRPNPRTLPSLLRLVSSALRTLASRVANLVSRSPIRPNNVPRKHGATRILHRHHAARPTLHPAGPRRHRNRRVVEAPRLAAIAFLLGSCVVVRRRCACRRRQCPGTLRRSARRFRSRGFRAGAAPLRGMPGAGNAGPRGSLQHWRRRLSQRRLRRAPSGRFAKWPQRRRWPHWRTTTWAWSR